MQRITKEEFYSVYKEKFEPVLKELEVERKKLETPQKIIGMTLIVLFALCFIGGFLTFLCPFLILLSPLIPFVIIVMIILAILLFTLDKSGKYKSLILPRILSLFGNFYLSNNKKVITEAEIQEFGLYPRANCKNSDDVILGTNNSMGMVIDECSLYLSSGKKSSKYLNFQGIILKFKLKKSLPYKLVITQKGASDIYSIPKLFNSVELEFGKYAISKVVYSTSPLKEGSYISSSEFFEKLEKFERYFTENISEDFQTKRAKNIPASVVQKFVGTSPAVSYAFGPEYGYVFIPTFKNFFEIYMMESLLNPDLYYGIYSDIQLMVDFVDLIQNDEKLYS